MTTVAMSALINVQEASYLYMLLPIFELRTRLEETIERN